MCIHEPACEPADCSGHGDCVQGECRCAGDFWRGPACDVLDCGPSNCSLHGTCTDCESLCCNRRCPWVALGGTGVNRSPGQSSAARCSTGVTCRGTTLCVTACGPGRCQSPFPSWAEGLQLRPFATSSSCFPPSRGCPCFGAQASGAAGADPPLCEPGGALCLSPGRTFWCTKLFFSFPPGVEAVRTYCLREQQHCQARTQIWKLEL